RAYAPSADRNCGALLAEVNHLLFETTSWERFVTIFYAVYDPSDRSLTWANAGHCSPLLMHTSGAARLHSLIQPAGIAPEVPVLLETIGVSPGDLLLIYSDGIPEACNLREEEFWGSPAFEAHSRKRAPAGIRVVRLYSGQRQGLQPRLPSGRRFDRRRREVS